MNNILSFISNDVLLDCFHSGEFSDDIEKYQKTLEIVGTFLESLPDGKDFQSVIELLKGKQA